MRLALLLSFSILSCATAAESTLDIRVDYQSLNDVQSYLQKRSPEDISNYQVPNSSSNLVIFQTIIFVQALRLGGIKDTIELNPENNSEEERIQLIISGKILAHVEAVWLNDIKTQSDIYIADAIFPEGSFFAG